MWFVIRAKKNVYKEKERQIKMYKKREREREKTQKEMKKCIYT